MQYRADSSVDRTRRGLSVASIAVIAALSGGCDNDAHVWGEVQCDGRPLTEGTVIFTPIDLKIYTKGSGPLDKKGRFKIFSSRRDQDLQPGPYWVSIRPPMYSSPETGEIGVPPGYPVSAKYLSEDAPAIRIDLKPEPIKLDLTLD